MELKYSNAPKREAKAVKAVGRNFNVSFKHAVEICDFIKGMRLTDAIVRLEGVVALEKTIPFKRFNKGIGHRRGLGKEAISRYPKKAAGEILGVLKNLSANAEFKGLDVEKLKITHVQANRGISRKRRKPKGRYTIWRTELCNVQAIAEESKK